VISATAASVTDCGWPSRPGAQRLPDVRVEVDHQGVDAAVAKEIALGLLTHFKLSLIFSVSDRVVRVDDSHADRPPTGAIWGRW
jgi:hypothetical protein